MISGRPSNRCCPRSRPSPKVAAPASRIAPPSVASSSCCGRDAPGGCSPKELGCGSGTTCWRRLRDWQEAGVWQRLHETLLNWLGDEAAIDWSPGQRGQPERPGEKGGEQTGPNPVDRGKPGSKYHLVVDRNGIPLAVRLSAANAHDATQLLPLGRRHPADHRAARGCRAGRASGRPSSTPTRRTTPRTSAAPCVLAASPHGIARRRDRLLSSDSGGTAGW